MQGRGLGWLTAASVQARIKNSKAPGHNVLSGPPPPTHVHN